MKFLVILVVIGLGIWIVQLQSMVREQKESLVVASEQLALEQEYSLALATEKLSVNTLDDGRVEVVNPSFNYSVFFPESRYNVGINTPGYIVIADPNNQGVFVEILAARRPEEFRSGSEDPYYPEDRNCTMDNVELPLGEADYYHGCDNWAYNHYELDTDGYRYNIRVSNDPAVTEQTQEIIRSLQPVTGR